jgi:LemA protein
MSVVTYAAVVLLVTGTAIYAVIVYNGLVRLQNEIGRAWANIDVLLKQRHDEIPNLVACVKGYMDHERQTLEAVTQARTASMNAVSIPQKAQADPLLTGALRSFFVVAERYPQLKADQNFLALQNRISELEERIADRREFFNDDVNTYNTRIAESPRSLPGAADETAAAADVPNERAGAAAGGSETLTGPGTRHRLATQSSKFFGQVSR